MEQALETALKSKPFAAVAICGQCPPGSKIHMEFIGFNQFFFYFIFIYSLNFCFAYLSIQEWAPAFTPK